MKYKKFTLIELVVTMAVFAILMLMVLKVFTTMQNAWNTTESLSRVMENARAVFDTIGEDLRYCVMSRQLNNEIEFYTGDIGGGPGVRGCDAKASSMGPFPVFVTNMGDREEGETDLTSRFCEVTYKVASSKVDGVVVKDADEEDVMFFHRRMVRSSDPGWDFYGQKGNKSWIDTASGADFQAVAAGILDIRFRFQRHELLATAGKTIYGQNYRQVNTEWVEVKSKELLNQLPKIIEVELTMYDPEVETFDEARKTKRTFFRRYFLEQYDY